MLACRYARPVRRENIPREASVPVVLYFITLSLPHLRNSPILRHLSLWPLFHTKPVYWERGEEIGPLTHRKRTTQRQPFVFWHSGRRANWQARPAPWPGAFLTVTFLWNVGAPCWGVYWGSKWPVSSNPSYLPPRPFSSTPWTPSQQFFGS